MNKIFLYTVFAFFITAIIGCEKDNLKKQEAEVMTSFD